MERAQVGSDSISSIGHEESSDTLEVEFTSGAIYQYFGVPKHLFDQLMEASSHGQFLHYNVKGHFPYEKVG